MPPGKKLRRGKGKGARELAPRKSLLLLPTPLEAQSLRCYCYYCYYFGLSTILKCAAQPYIITFLLWVYLFFSLPLSYARVERVRGRGKGVLRRKELNGMLITPKVSQAVQNILYNLAIMTTNSERKATRAGNERIVRGWDFLREEGAGCQHELTSGRFFCHPPTR